MNRKETIVLSGSATLSPEAKAAMNAYKRRWRHDNPDKVREANRRYWEKRVRIEADRMLREQEAADEQ